MLQMLTSHAGVPASPMRLLEMLTDRFGVFEALAHSTIKLNRCTSADELSMDPKVAEAVLEFAGDLRTARAASGAWSESNGLVHPLEDCRQRGWRLRASREPENQTAAGQHRPRLSCFHGRACVPDRLPPLRARGCAGCAWRRCDARKAAAG
jgi:hypothetical protein